MSEQHPITQPISHEELAERVAQLWDQVWWLSLPTEQRTHYETEGHQAPIQHFYHTSNTEGHR